MTTETLKPFIPTTQCVDNFPAAVHSSAARRQRTTKLMAIGLSATAVLLTFTLLGLMIWNMRRVSHLETEVMRLDKVIVSMQKRLGINYLDDFNEFEKEYTNALIDDPSTLDDVDANDEDLIEDNEHLLGLHDVDDDDVDDDEDNDDELDDDDDDDDIDDDEDDEFSYEELRRKYGNYEDDVDDEDEDDENMNTSDDDNLYDDFEKYKDSKKKQESSRKPRAIALEQLNETQETIKRNRSTPTTDNKAPQQTVAQRHQQQKKKMLMQRLPNIARLDSADSADGQRKITGATTAQRRRAMTHRRHRDYRKTKNAILKSAKTTRQLQPLGYSPAAHFHLNRKIADRYAPISVDSYSGDMYIGHPSWSNEIDIDSYFKVDNGVLTVHEPGLYYVYAQVCYNNTHDQNGFVIFHGHRPFLQCLNTVPTNLPHKIHTCHTSGLIYLKENETIHLRDFHTDRNVILKDANNRSYFGLMKI